MQRIFVFLLAIFCFTGTWAASDSLDVHHYEIHLDSLGVTARFIKGHSLIKASPTVNNLGTFSLDLLRLQVDSVQINGATVPHTHNDTVLSIYPGQTFNLGDTLDVEVWYEGQPYTGGNNFGGWYTVGGYVFNLGVGIGVEPPNLGKVWFPCNDNFTDKATYEVWVRTPANRIGVSGGTLLAEIPNPDGSKTWHWSLRDPIPTYLASVATGEYVALRDTFPSTGGGQIPVTLYVRPVDSAGALASFANLQAGFDAFEQRFGSYRWERVGFVAVPFNGGAMEHATNVAYPNFAINGNLSWETLWAHELSHAWFGNLVTCSEASEMWLNEGWASFAEAIMTEAVYGSQAYLDYNRALHSDVLRRAHIQDGGHRAVSGIPAAYTYGWHVYSKGALMAHTLRGQMGDSAFFDGIQYYLDQKAFGNADTDTLEAYLEASSGQSLGDFFDGWVHQPGSPHFSIDSFRVTGSTGNYTLSIYVRQRLRAAPNFVRTRVPFLIASQGQSWVHREEIGGPLDTVVISGLTGPDAGVVLDPFEELADASVGYYDTLYSGGGSFPYAFMTISPVQTFPLAIPVRVTHNWVAPDSFKTPRPGIKLNDYRYWKIEGNNAIIPGLHSSIIFEYNRRPSSTGLLDHTWMTNREDSLILFYRANTAEDWREVGGYTINAGNLNDGVGQIVVDTMRFGEYAMGQYEGFVALEEREGESLSFEIHPNPATDHVQLALSGKGPWEMLLFDAAGRRLRRELIRDPHYVLSRQNLSEGAYFLQVIDQNYRSGLQKIIFQ